MLTRFNYKIILIVLNGLSVIILLAYLRYAYSIIGIVGLIISISLFCLTLVNYKQSVEFSKWVKIALTLCTLLFFIVTLIWHSLRTALCNSMYYTSSKYFLVNENYSGKSDLYSTAQFIVIDRTLKSSDVIDKLEKQGWSFKSRGSDGGVDFIRFSKELSILPYRIAHPEIEIDVISSNLVSSNIYTDNKIEIVAAHANKPGEITYSYFHNLSRLEAWLIDKKISSDLNAAMDVKIQPQNYSKIRVSTQCLWQY